MNEKQQRFFYECDLKAGIAAKHFDIKLEDEAGRPLEFMPDCNLFYYDELDGGIYRKPLLFVRPASADAFKPVLDDVIRYHSRTGATLYQLYNNKVFHGFSVDEIIKRDGKMFPWYDGVK